MKLDSRKEQQVLNGCDRVVIVTDGFFDSIDGNKTQKIPNGFDPDDYSFLEKESQAPLDNIFTICYMGSLKARQYVDSFFEVLSLIQQKYPKTESKIQLKFIGNVDPAIKSKIAEKYPKLNPVYSGYLNHTEALRQAKSADLLLLIIGKSHIAHRILTGKLFEYLMLRKSILACGPKNGAAHQVLEQTKAGQLFDYDDFEGIETFIVECFEKWENNDVHYVDQLIIEQYNRKQLTKKLVDIYEALL